MKICVISGGYAPFLAGAEVFCKRVSEHMSARGHAVHVVTSGDDRAGADRFPGLPPYAVENGVHVHRVRSLKVRYLQTLSLIPSLLGKARELCRQQTFDLIHAYIFPGLVVGARLERLTGLPLLITVAGVDLAYYPRSPMVNAVLRMMTRPALPRARSVHAVCSSLANRARLLGAVNTTVVPCAVDHELFCPGNPAELHRELGIPTGVKLVVGTGRLQLEKGVDVLLRSFHRLVQSGISCRLLLIGQGPLEKSLRQLAGELGVQDHVQFIGYLAQPELARYLAAADLFVLPSLAEGLPMSILEAMACGTAVVASNVDGTPDVIRDGDNGLLAPPSDVTALADRMRQILTDDDLRRRLASAGLRTAQQQFSWGPVLQQMEALYETIVR